MSKRASKRAIRALKERQIVYDRDSVDEKASTKMPGSTNPRKSHGGRQTTKR